MISEATQALFEQACKAMKAEGANVVAVVCTYADKGDAHFSTKISITPQPEYGVSLDHIMLDTLRELTLQWHGIAHS